MHAGGRGCGEESGVTTVSRQDCLEWVTSNAVTGKSHSKSKNQEVFGPHPPVLMQAMQGPLRHFVQWKIYPLQIFVMCHISQPVAHTDLPAEGFIGPAGRGAE